MQSRERLFVIQASHNGKTLSYDSTYIVGYWQIRDLSGLSSRTLNTIWQRLVIYMCLSTNHVILDPLCALFSLLNTPLPSFRPFGTTEREYEIISLMVKDMEKVPNQI